MIRSETLPLQAACPHLPWSAGPGAFDFKQGDTNGTAFWRVVRNFLRVPSREQEQCQLPKPILLDTGNVHLPYDWCVTPPHTMLLAAVRGVLLLCSFCRSQTRAVDVLPLLLLLCLTALPVWGLRSQAWICPGSFIAVPNMSVLCAWARPRRAVS